MLAIVRPGFANDLLPAGGYPRDISTPE